jgi:PKD repeat protein
LTRNGADVNPDYSLTIYGHGSLEYYGNENVSTRGKIEEKISRDKVIFLLSEFKKSGFFSLKDVYMVDESLGRSFTIVSISIPGKDGEVRTKTISHYQDDSNVPVELKNLEDKIDEIVGSERWIGPPSEAVFEPLSETRGEPAASPQISEKPLKPKKEKTYPIKAIIGVAVVVIVFVIVAFAVFSGIFNISDTDKQNNDIEPVAEIFFEPVGGESLTMLFNCSGISFDGEIVSYDWDFGDGHSSTEQNTTNTYSEDGVYTVTLTVTDSKGVSSTYIEEVQVNEYNTPKFTNVIPTRNSSKTNGKPPEITVFQQDEKIYIYYEFRNVAHILTNYKGYNCTVEISVLSENDCYHNISKKYKKDNYSGEGLFYDIDNFTTNDSWPINDYLVDLILWDNISDKSASAQFSFTLVEKHPEIKILATASDIRAYQDYDAATQFEQNDTIFVYLEYMGIHTINDNTICDINLQINVTQDGIEYYSSSENKTQVGNNAHAWWFTTDDSWPISPSYKISVKLIDYANDVSTSEITYFSLS